MHEWSGCPGGPPKNSKDDDNNNNNNKNNNNNNNDDNNNNDVDLQKVDLQKGSKWTNTISFVAGLIQQYKTITKTTTRTTTTITTITMMFILICKKAENVKIMVTWPERIKQ